MRNVCSSIFILNVNFEIRSVIVNIIFLSNLNGGAQASTTSSLKLKVIPIRCYGNGLSTLPSINETSVNVLKLRIDLQHNTSLCSMCFSPWREGDSSRRRFCDIIKKNDELIALMNQKKNLNISSILSSGKKLSFGTFSIFPSRTLTSVQCTVSQRQRCIVQRQTACAHRMSECFQLN